MAEIMGLSLKLKAKYGGTTAKFTRAKRDRFVGAGELGIFTSVERQQIIFYTIQEKPSAGGAGLDVRDLMAQKIIEKVFPLHEETARQQLILTWAKRWFAPQPLTEIKDYFGEKIALYFAFLGYYTQWLIFASAIGIPAVVCQIIQGFDNSLVPIYCILLSFLVTFFLEGWKRRNAELAYQFDSYGYEEEEPVRPNFQGIPKKGFYSEQGDFVPLDELSGRLPYVEESVYFPREHRHRRYGIAAAVVILMIVIVIVAATAILAFKFLLQSINSKYGVVAAWANAVVIIVFNGIYSKIAVALNEWENHRTETAYEDALITKIFLFQFINSYISLFYTAFVMYGENSERAQNGTMTLWGVKQRICKGDSCMDELALQLGSLFMTALLIGNLREVGVPYLMGKLKMWMEDRKMRKQSKTGVIKAASVAEKESKLAFYSSPFEDYSEMVIQFGYVTLFAAAFPLASVLALLNNVVEIRTDATKLLIATQRPIYRRASDIGNWFKILEIISFASVLTNLGIVLFTSNAVQKLFNLSFGQTILLGFVAEHVILITKWIIAEMIPDVPASIRKKLALKKYIAKVDRIADMDLRKRTSSASKPRKDSVVSEGPDSDNYEEDDE
eukprot:CAMPEP_0196663698 /NCGR_PEP_ID=MMETSP1086-20130531/53863_1 /TAXON_ID=77921 /ORGANISM="Cyanoptyche  gloeocystis , Strain SAG4.97" /LENGTH=614 /DNA_ID=CAMNT_0041999615 /DNA_START=136 /DNA_END=1983 /DNA_ORIENTATION=+